MNSLWVRRDPPATMPVIRAVWKWFLCRDGHCKMLSDHKPVCPVCNWAMEPAE